MFEHLSRPVAVVGVLAAAAIVATPTQAASSSPPSCSPDADLLGFTDALNKTAFQGVSVGGLSAIARTGGDRAIALTDNQGTTPARFFTLKLKLDHGRLTAQTTKVTQLKRPDGTAFTGADFDGEGIVASADGSILASSETEPAIRRFDADGDQLAELNVPPRFAVAPAGQATNNLTFEGLTETPDGKTLIAGMEGPLSADGVDKDGRPRLRFLRYDRPRRGDFIPTAQYAYLADAGLAVTEVQAIDGDSLLVLERGFVAGTGNTVRVYRASLGGAKDVSKVAALNDDSPFLYKQLLFDVAKCPSMGATTPGTQPNPLLDNIEGMALGDKLGRDRRELTLISDDNFSAGQVTRVYDFSVRLPDEPVLEGRATYDATQLQPGPVSGTVGVDPNNGQMPPFNGQPIPGFSGALTDGPGRYLAMPDNGFGSKGNSSDFLLRVYKIKPSFPSGKIDVDGFLSLRDPDHKIPFGIVRSDRLLTGGDFDIEAIARDRKGDLWFGDEFGPYLLHTDATGKVLDAPVPLPDGKAPQSPDLQPGEPATVRSSRGFESVASSPDGRFLYPMLEGFRLDDGNLLRRWIYEFDVAAKRYTGRKWQYKADFTEAQIGDLQAIGKDRFLLIERDDDEGKAAKVKNVMRIDLNDTDADGFVKKTRVLDLLHIRDPSGITQPGDFGLGDPFSYPLQSVESIVPLAGNRLFVVNDNNFPDSNGRHPGRPDDIEAIVVRVPGGLDE